MEHIALVTSCLVGGLVSYYWWKAKQKREKAHRLWVEEMRQDLHAKLKYSDELLSLKKRKFKYLEDSAQWFAFVFMDTSLLRNLQMLAFLLKRIEKDIQFELALLRPPKGDETYQQDKLELLTFRFSLESFLEFAFEEKTERGELQNRFHRIAEIYHESPFLFDIPNENANDSSESTECIKSIESTREVKAFITSLLQKGVKENVADFQILVDKAHDRAKEGLRFFGMDDSKSGQCNMMQLLIAILQSGDSIDTQKAKIIRLLQLEQEGIQWGCSRPACMIL